MPENERIAVVTGANRGLGLETSRRLLAEGFRVVMTGRRKAAVEAAAAPLRAKGGRVEAMELDVGSDASVAAFVEALEAEGLAEVEVLVNNAGAILDGDHAGKASEVEPSVLLRTVDNNAIGAFRVARALLPTMRARGRGRIVNVSSGMGGLAEMDGGWPGYRMSKAALNAVTRLLHAEAGEGVLVNSVCPGWVRTDMGGRGATRSVEEGAAGIVWAATLPADGPSGGFFRDGEATPW